MLKRVHFGPSVLPYLLVTPQILITVLFFLWPAARALYQSVLVEDPFGLSSKFVWFENFEALLTDEAYLQAFGRTFAFSGLVAGL